MAFKAKITQVSEVEPNFTQSVTFDILNANDKILTSSSATGDVEQLIDQIKDQVTQYELKYKSVRKLKVGDVLEV